MSRYFDADSIRRIVKEKTNPYGKPTLYYEIGVKVLEIDNEPTADVVEVVRCKDCAYYREETSYCLNHHCSSSYYGHRVREHHYCSHGERSEGDV